MTVTSIFILHFILIIAEMSAATLTPETVHALIQEAFLMKSRAYAPYSNFPVGAALLCEDGTIVGGCNVENACSPCGICAECTAVPKAVTMGYQSFLACVVTSKVPDTSTTPCGICRQVLAQFLPPTAPVIMVSSTYAAAEATPSNELVAAMTDKGYVAPKGQAAEGREWEDVVKIMTIDELLPAGFGRHRIPKRENPAV